MADWYPDKGLATLIAQWREEHPGAVVGTIADENHNPPSEHIPEADGSVDAGDFMEGNGVTQADLDDLAERLRAGRDRRIAYVIRRQRIFSSTVQPWVWRTYTGAYHGHTHVSVNDLHENDTTRWAGVDRSEEDDMAGYGFVPQSGYRLDKTYEKTLNVVVPALATIQANLAQLAGTDWVDEQAVVDGVLAGLVARDDADLADALRAVLGDRAAAVGALLTSGAG